MTISTTLLWLTRTFSGTAMVKVNGFSLNVWFGVVPSGKNLNISLFPPAHTPTFAPSPPAHTPTFALSPLHTPLPSHSLPPTDGMTSTPLTCPESSASFNFFPFFMCERKSSTVLPHSHENSLLLPPECIHVGRKGCDCACLVIG